MCQQVNQGMGTDSELASRTARMRIPPSVSILQSDHATHSAPVLPLLPNTSPPSPQSAETAAPSSQYVAAASVVRRRVPPGGLAISIMREYT